MRLDEKYRPHSLDTVIGQDKAVAILRRVSIAGRGIYITGKSGTGKTTIARIIALQVAGSTECITETTGRELTVSALRAWCDNLAHRPLYGKGYALIVNESHGMAKPAVEMLLNVLEALPEHAIIVFTTTREGAELFEDSAFDAAPFASRCLQISLASRGITDQLAAHLQECARREGLDGKDIGAYVELLRQVRNNVREAFNRIESGYML